MKQESSATRCWCTCWLAANSTRISCWRSCKSLTRILQQSQGIVSYWYFSGGGLYIVTIGMWFIYSLLALSIMFAISGFHMRRENMKNFNQNPWKITCGYPKNEPAVSNFFNRTTRNYLPLLLKTCFIEFIYHSTQKEQ